MMMLLRSCVQFTSDKPRWTPDRDIHTCIYIGQQKLEAEMQQDVLTTPGHLISLAARGFARLSEARLRPLGFGVGHVPVLIALQDGRADTQRDLARFAKVEQPPMSQMLARMERDGLIKRTPDPADGRSRRIGLTEPARVRLPEACSILLEGNREALGGFTDEESEQFTSFLNRLISNLDRLATPGTTPNSPE